MRTRVFPVLVDVGGRRVATGLKAAAAEKPVVVALRLRDRGWDPYRVSFDANAGKWVASVFQKHAYKTRLRANG